MRILQRRYIKEAEAMLLRYELRLGNDSRLIKKALQRLCTHYEAKRKLLDPTDHRQLIHSHLSSKEVLHRRWSMKALGLIGHKDDNARLIDRLKIETDLEALTWGTAALLTTAGDRSMDELCAAASLEKSAPFWLAARLYAPDAWLRKHWRQTNISLHDDDITLKWAIFLAGYGKAPEDMFDPKFENKIFLGQLNKHSSPEISEYSTWALWERAEYSLSDCTIPVGEFSKDPENVRKWLYRLLTKSTDANLLDPNLIEDLRLNDQSASAREGLALGLSGNLSPRLYRPVLEWYENEVDTSVQTVLLSAMASNGDQNADFADVVARRFTAAPVGETLRANLLSASEGTALFRVLKRQDLNDEYTKKGLFHFGLVPDLNIGNVQELTLGNTFKVGRDLNAQNIAGGDMHAGAISAVQVMHTPQDQAILQRVLDFTSSSQIPLADKEAVDAAVKAAAQSPSPETRTGVLAALSKVGAAVGTVAGLAEIIEAVRDWLS